jgi:hypothetical protein
MTLPNGLAAQAVLTHCAACCPPGTEIHRMSAAQAKWWHENIKLADAPSREVRALLASAPAPPATSSVEVAWCGQGV